MPSSSATARIAGSETQPSCFWTSHSSRITGGCWRACGYLAIHHRASFNVSLENSKLSGWTVERRRTLNGPSLHEVDAGDLAAGEGVDGRHLEGLPARAADDL